MKVQARPKTATSSIQAQSLHFHSSGLGPELENTRNKDHILPCLEIIYLSFVILKKKKKECKRWTTLYIFQTKRGIELIRLKHNILI